MNHGVVGGCACCLCDWQQSRRCWAVLSLPCLRRADTLETVVVRCGEGSWPEADSGPSSTGQQWCIGFWSSQFSSGPAGWSLQSDCDVWLSVGRVCSGLETCPVLFSESEPNRQEPKYEEGGAPLGLKVCQGCWCEMESSECGYWKFCWCKTDETRLRCRLSQVDMLDLWKVLWRGPGSAAPSRRRLCSKEDTLETVVNRFSRVLPYILAYKSQNLPQNLDLKAGGAKYAVSDRKMWQRPIVWCRASGTRHLSPSVVTAAARPSLSYHPLSVYRSLLAWRSTQWAIKNVPLNFCQ